MHSFKPGTRIGSYAIGRGLARGGMGTVYVARGADGRRVAVERELATEARPEDGK